MFFRKRKPWAPPSPLLHTYRVLRNSRVFFVERDESADNEDVKWVRLTRYVNYYNECRAVDYFDNLDQVHSIIDQNNDHALFQQPPTVVTTFEKTK
jgi:hypothetical protein